MTKELKLDTNDPATPSSDGSSTFISSPKTSPTKGKPLSNLTINVQETMGWRPQAQALQERTNSAGFTPGFTILTPSISSSASYTPGTSNTFGVPNPMNQNYDTPSSNGSKRTDSPGHSISFNSNKSSPQSASLSRTRLQPYNVPSTFNQSRSGKQPPRTSVASRVQSRNFSLTPTVGESFASRTHSRSASTTTFRFPSESRTVTSREASRSGANVPLPDLDSMSRRERRYTVAETSLSSSLSHLLPLQDRLDSPKYVRQREVAGIEKALLAIGERVREETEKLEELTRLMKEGHETQDEYQERRNERWRIEKRLEVLGEERKTLENRSKELTMGAMTVEATQAQPIPTSSLSSRTKRNLQLFFSGVSSPTKTPLRPHSISRNRHRIQHLAISNLRPRRMTLHDVQPMKLRRRSVEETFAGIIRARAAELKAIRPKEPQQPYLFPRRHIISKSLPETENFHPSLAAVMEIDTEPSPSPVHATATPAHYDHSPTPKTPDTGTALIFRQNLTPSEVDTDDMDVEIPAYAQDLFTQFERGSGRVNVKLEVRKPSTPSTPPKSPRKRLLRRSHPSPSKEVGHGLLMPRPSIVLPEIDKSSLFPAPRPISSIVTSSRVSSTYELAADRERQRELASSPTPTLGKKLTMKFTKKIFGKR